MPGAKWVNYVVEKTAPLSQERTDSTSRKPFTLAHFALDGPVLPLVQDTLPIAERVRGGLMGIYKRLKLQMIGEAEGVRVASRVFSGKDELGRPLVGHRHAFFLPADEDGDGRIDHVTVFAAAGFDGLEARALGQLRRLPGRDDDGPLHALCVGLGEAGDFTTPWLRPARVWISATPFVVTRMPKRRGRKKDPPHLLGPDNRDAFAAQVLRELIARRGLSDPVAVEPLRRVGPRQLRPIQFQRFRRKHSDDGGHRPAAAFRIEFPDPVPGPLCLGHSCHFGLGLFVPEEASRVASAPGEKMAS